MNYVQPILKNINLLHIMEITEKCYVAEKIVAQNNTHLFNKSKQWFEINKLVLNESKTNKILFPSRELQLNCSITNV